MDEVKICDPKKDYFQELHDFFSLVKEMREAQKSYFRSRDGNALEKSKRLEKEVDSEIRRLERIVGDQKTIF